MIKAKQIFKMIYVPNTVPIEVDAGIVSHWSSHKNPVIVQVHTREIRRYYCDNHD
jgi:hypothetical protein